ncbi:BCCT family transporter [Halomonas borealis]|uniref:BCCT family transporter n=1 Tax=Halomonas borealis TaxID=2508710 RepID=UPI0010A00321|nr:BCCT family transporter [Halomonas borealis]
MHQNLRHLTFYPSLLVLGTLTGMAVFGDGLLLSFTEAIHEWLITNFGWLYALTAFVLVIMAFLIFLSPLAKLRIGGESAKPLLTRWKWCSITLCSSIAIGLLFFAAAEPIFFIMTPPPSSGVEAMSNKSALFGLSSLFMHWSFTTYAIYAIPALIFAIAHYNMKMPFSISSAMSAGLPLKMTPVVRQLVDAVALISLVAGIVASLGLGAMMLGGGIQRLFDINVTSTMVGMLCVVVMAGAAISAASGLLKGITFLSSWNARALILLAVVIFIMGPSSFIANSGVDALGSYLSNFISSSLDTGTVLEDSWPRDWTLFFWANWFAWAPITAIFLGKIARGYTVREFLVFNFLLPSCFVIVWSSVFGGLSIHVEMATQSLSQVLAQEGAGDVIWAMLEQLPGAKVLMAVFLCLSIVSYVTAADSAVDAISGICAAKSNNSEVNSSPYYIKLLWGGIISVISLTLTSTGGLDGLKMISTLGGFLGMIIVGIGAVSLARIAFSLDGNAIAHEVDNKKSSDPTGIALSNTKAPER